MVGKIIFPVIIGILILGTLGLSQDVFAQIHSAATFTQLSNDNGTNVLDLDMISEGDNIYLIWRGEEDAVGEGLLFTKSSDGGHNFENPRLLPFTSFDATLHISGSTLYLLGLEFDNFFETNIISLHKSIDNGQNFIETKIETETDSGIGFNDPKVVSSDGIFYVIWLKSESPSEGEDTEVPRLAISTNNGDTFGAPFDLSSSNMAHIEDFVSVNGDAFVLWSENDDGDHLKLFFQAIDDGVVIHQKVEIPTTSNFHSADLAVVGNDVVVSFTETPFPIASEIYTTKSTSRTNFETAKLLLDSNERNFQFRERNSVSSNQNNVGIWWFGFDPNAPNAAATIYYANSANSGDTYSTKILQDNPNQSFNGDSKFKDEIVFVVWGENTDQGQSGTENIVTLAISADSGDSFDVPLEIHRTAFTSNNIFVRTQYPPTIMDVQDDVYIAWQNSISGDARDAEVYFILVDICNPPISGDWTPESCLVTGDLQVNGNIIINPGVLVTILGNSSLGFDCSNFALVKDTGGIKIKEGGKFFCS